MFVDRFTFPHHCEQVEPIFSRPASSTAFPMPKSPWTRGKRSSQRGRSNTHSRPPPSSLRRPAPRGSQSRPQRPSQPSSRQSPSLSLPAHHRAETPLEVLQDHLQDGRSSQQPPPGEDGSDGVNEVIMALSMANSDTVGCAYYIAADEVLYLHNDAPMAGVELVEALVCRIQPTTVIISSRATGSLVEYLERRAQSPQDNHSGGQPNS